uniref:Uncharacterized protein n=1 Tax=Arion vulgaris TaxID=1028688 RepID=A0A0B6Z4Z8_9EUPU
MAHDDGLYVTIVHSIPVRVFLLMARWIQCMPQYRRMCNLALFLHLGSKRERIIGSVFVKNLPKGTSKDMLRVMFPFAPEINYNPEKFQDG